jgi:hypothetical protein
MPANDVVLSEEQRIELSSIAQSRSLPAGYVFRVRLILMLAEGAPYSLIKRQLRTTAPTISRWRVRFLRSGIDGLDTRHPGQSATVVTPRVAGQDTVGHAEKAEGRLDALELPQTGCGPRCQQRCRASHLEGSWLETASAGTLHGQQRSGL